MPPFKFLNGAPVEISVSGERGWIVARTERLSGAPTYRVRYAGANGMAYERDMDENALIALGPDVVLPGNPVSPIDPPGGGEAPPDPPGA